MSARTDAMTVISVPPSAECAVFLPGHDYADAFRAPAADGIDAIEVARRAFAAPPRWAAALMRLRDRIVAPFGLKPAPAEGFPVIFETPVCVVLGFDDRHLDFRVVVTVAEGVATLTTLVRRHNALGRIYLAAILPLHRLIARSFAKRMA